MTEEPSRSLKEIYTQSALSDIVKENLLRDFYFCQYIDRCVLKKKTIEISLMRFNFETKNILETANEKEIEAAIYRAVREILQMSFHGQIDELEKEKRIRVILI